MILIYNVQVASVGYSDIFFPFLTLRAVANYKAKEIKASQPAS